MPKKMGVNSKAEEARARKGAIEAEQKLTEAREKEEQYWREAEGSKSRSTKKREEENKKKAEDDSIIEASTVEDAIAKMAVSDNLPVDRHPERRLKASFKVRLMERNKRRDCMSSQQLVDYVRELLNIESKLSAVCERVFYGCLAPSTGGEGCDNMTMILVQFKKPVTSCASVQVHSQQLHQPFETNKIEAEIVKSSSETGKGSAKTENCHVENDNHSSSSFLMDTT